MQSLVAALSPFSRCLPLAPVPHLGCHQPAGGTAMVPQPPGPCPRCLLSKEILLWPRSRSAVDASDGAGRRGSRFGHSSSALSLHPAPLSAQIPTHLLRSGFCPLSDFGQGNLAAGRAVTGARTTCRGI